MILKKLILIEVLNIGFLWFSLFCMCSVLLVDFSLDSGCCFDFMYGIVQFCVRGNDTVETRTQKRLIY